MNSLNENDGTASPQDDATEDGQVVDLEAGAAPSQIPIRPGARAAKAQDSQIPIRPDAPAEDA